MNFSPTELYGLIFVKKICPKCGSVLEKRVSDSLIKRGWKTRKFLLGFLANYGKHYLREINYYCNNCGDTLSLQELGERILNNPFKKITFCISSIIIPIVILFMVLFFSTKV